MTKKPIGTRIIKLNEITEHKAKITLRVCKTQEKKMATGPRDKTKKKFK